jgi:hypothetical protein
MVTRHRARGALAVGALALWGFGCGDAPFGPAGSAATLSIAAEFGARSSEEVQAAQQVDRVRVLFVRSDQHVAVDETVTWPGDALTLDLGPYRLPLRGESDQFTVTVTGYSGTQPTFIYGPQTVTVTAGQTTSVDALLQYIGVGFGEFALEITGAMELSARWYGAGITVQHLGQPAWDYSWVVGFLPSAEYPFLVLSVPGHFQAGSYAFVTPDLVRLYGNDDSIFSEAPFAALIVDAFDDQFGYTEVLYVTTGGSMTVSSVTPPSSTESGRVAGTVSMQARRYSVRYAYEGGTDVTQHAETISLSGAFDLPFDIDVEGSASATVTGGPFPGSYRGSGYAWRYVDQTELYVSTWGYDGPDSELATYFVIPATTPGEYPIPEPVAITTYYWSVNADAYGDATAGTLELLEFVPPPSTMDHGQVRGSFVAQVPTVMWTGSEYVESGTAQVSMAFHLPVWIMTGGAPPDPAWLQPAADAAPAQPPRTSPFSARVLPLR